MRLPIGFRLATMHSVQTTTDATLWETLYSHG